MDDHANTESGSTSGDTEVERVLREEREKAEGERLEMDVPHGVGPGTGTVAIGNKKEDDR